MTLAHPFFPRFPALLSGSRHGRNAFTLIEIMVAAVASAIVLAAIYGIFYRAIKMRDSATERNHQARLRARAVNVIRNDLKNALISGGILASTLQGDSSSTDSTGSVSDAASPGYLKFTTTTGKDTADETYGDVQQVEYYIAKDQANSGNSNAGTLVRVVTRDLLDSQPTVTHEEQLLPGVQSFQVSFYDGTTWQTSWQISGTGSASGTSSTTSTTTSGSNSNAQAIPAAIRVDIQQVAPAGNAALASKAQQPVAAPAPVEILVPWEVSPFISGTNYTIGSGTVAPIPEDE
ncbi:MAG: type II secretion system protein GspJ [Chthoniobacteraceae bacterium]